MIPASDRHDDQRAVRVRIDGRVQGVGFRFFCQRLAREHGVFGWARNEPDGSVLLEASGNGPQISLFLDAVRTGPQLALVSKMSVSEIAFSTGRQLDEFHIF